MFYLAPSPLQTICHPILAENNIRLSLKRDDLLHPDISGNKWRKMKYNLIEAQQQNFTSLVTFGGAFSNHIYATAAAGKVFGFETYGIVRGDELNEQSSTTLSFAASCGMKMFFVSRTAYRDKAATLNSLVEEYPFLANSYYLPEGGSNHLAIKGVAEMVEEIYLETQPDYITSAVGTGGTIAGIAAASRTNTQVIGFLALKGAGGIQQDIHDLLTQNGYIMPPSFGLMSTYHFGGYAKHNAQLWDFIHDFEKYNPSVRLEQVYTGKMLFGIFDLIQKGYFLPNSHLVAIHTGGLQGRILGK